MLLYGKTRSERWVSILVRTIDLITLTFLIFQIFRNLHLLYTDAICNPFYIPGESLTSK